MKRLPEAPSGALASWRRWRWKPVALVALVTLVHLWMVAQVQDLARLGSGAADTSPVRIDVAFVRELAQAEPPPVAPRAPRTAPAMAPQAATTPAQAASSPADVAASAPAASAAAATTTDTTTPVDQTPAADPAAQAAAQADRSAAQAEQAAQAVARAASEAAPSAPAFQWPPSTRLSYTLVGDFRGPVQGKARVEWLRSGARYQVHLDVRVGSDFAPLLSRRMSSDGLLTEAGLQPQRYDEETKVLLREPRRQTILFEPERIVLARGAPQPSMAGVQDTASQFVQLSWLFTLQPHLLRIGQTVEVPLALPRRVDRWIYDVVGQEVLSLPVGEVKAWHLKPRPLNKTGGDLSVEIWFAPSLQYLPVRILIRQDEASYIDLALERLPQQEAAPTPVAPAAPTRPL